jgi:crossover junction endodeoxyribonuclease RuvC
VIVLGIDPGLAATGYGVVRSGASGMAALGGGVVRTAAGDGEEQRLVDLHDAVLSLIDEYSPEFVALERLYFNRNVSSALAVGQARGVVLLAAGQAGLPCSSYTPQQIKAAVCGSGAAGKDQVARMVKALLALQAAPTSDHASDAFAAAICHLNSAPLSAALAAQR